MRNGPPPLLEQGEWLETVAAATAANNAALSGSWIPALVVTLAVSERAGQATLLNEERDQLSPHLNQVLGFGMNLVVSYPGRAPGLERWSREAPPEIQLATFILRPWTTALFTYTH